MWNPWKQLRLGGSLAIIGGSLFNNTLVVLIGFVIQYIGVIGAVDLLERRIAVLEPKEIDSASDRDE